MTPKSKKRSGLQPSMATASGRSSKCCVMTGSHGTTRKCTMRQRPRVHLQGVAAMVPRQRHHHAVHAARKADTERLPEPLLRIAGCQRPKKQRVFALKDEN